MIWFLGGGEISGSRVCSYEDENTEGGMEVNQLLIRAKAQVLFLAGAGGVVRLCFPFRFSSKLELVRCALVDAFVISILGKSRPSNRNSGGLSIHVLYDQKIREAQPMSGSVTFCCTTVGSRYLRYEGVICCICVISEKKLKKPRYDTIWKCPFF